MDDEVAPGGLLMDGSEIRGGGDALLGKQRLDGGTVGDLRQPNDEDEPADGAAGQPERRQFDAGDVCKQ